jgi:hypothetical protein
MKPAPFKHSIYSTYGKVEINECFDAFEQQIETFQDKLHDKFPSVYACLRWLDKFDCAIADNKFAYFGVTEYDGYVSIWVAPKHVNKLQVPIRDKWLSQIDKSFLHISKKVFNAHN